LLFFVSGVAQSQEHTQDSLWLLWNNKNLSDEIRFKAIDELAYLHFHNNIDSSLALAKIEKAFAFKAGRIDWKLKGMTALATALYDKRDLKDSLAEFESCLVLAKKYGKKKQEAVCLNGISNIYADYGDNVKAIDYIRKCIKISESIKDSTAISNGYYNLSMLYNTLEEPDEALRWLGKSIAIDQRMNHRFNVVYSLDLMATIYNKKLQHSKALSIFKQALKLAGQLNDSSMLSLLYNDIGVTYKGRKVYDSALFYYFKAYDLRLKFGNKQEVAGTALNIANVYLLTNKNDQALFYGEMGLQFSKEAQYLEWIQNGYNILYEAYKKAGKHELALKMFEQYLEVKDSLVNSKAQNELVRQEFKYNYEKQALSDSIKNAEERRMSTNKLSYERSMRYFLFAGLAFTFVFGVFMFNRFKVAKRQKLQIEIQKRVVEEQKLLVEEKRREVLDSIHYAKRIQLALLPSQKSISKILKDLNE
jgi:tetratricopeptide (TPR) repeat protein